MTSGWLTSNVTPPHKHAPWMTSLMTAPLGVRLVARDATHDLTTRVHGSPILGSMIPAPGLSLRQYRLIEQIGEGGMGVVWRATDGALGRDAAIKFLPDLFSRDTERLARFEREAKLLASLSHPNIAAVYGLHVVDGLRFLAMEMVKGEDLAARLSRGPIPVDETVAVGRQIAE